jgi:hypothetical protein
VKVFAVFQLIWFTVRMVIHFSRHYAFTHLELASFTYVVCAVISCLLHWSKPQGIESPIVHTVPCSDLIRPVTDIDIAVLRGFGGTAFLERNFVPPFA